MHSLQLWKKQHHQTQYRRIFFMGHFIDAFCITQWFWPLSYVSSWLYSCFYSKTQSGWSSEESRSTLYHPLKLGNSRTVDAVNFFFSSSSISHLWSLSSNYKGYPIQGTDWGSRHFWQNPKSKRLYKLRRPNNYLTWDFVVRQWSGAAAFVVLCDIVVYQGRSHAQCIQSTLNRNDTSSS